MSANRIYGSPPRWMLPLFHREFWVWVGIGVISIASALFMAKLAFGAAQLIPKPLIIKNSLGTWRAVIGNDGSSFGTITRGKKAAGAVGQICASCTMPSPEQLGDAQWMDFHLLYQVADPTLATASGLVCETPLTPTIIYVRTISARTGLWYGKIRIACAG